MDHASRPDIPAQTIEAEPSRLGYWNPELLSSFTFLMSGHGSPVCASMMLGDADYARVQLRLACTLNDQMLQQVAVEMLSAVTHLATNRNRWVQLSQ